MGLSKKTKKFGHKIVREIKRAGKDVKQFLRDDDDRAKHCFDIIKQNNIQICSRDTKKVLDTITNLNFDYDHPRLDRCLKQFEKEGYIECKHLIKATPETCLIHLENQEKKLCNKEGASIKTTDVLVETFTFYDNNPEIVDNCYNAILGHNGIIVCPSQTNGGDL